MWETTSVTKPIGPSKEDQFEKTCSEVWAAAWSSTASATNCTRASECTRYADECLLEFTKRFDCNGRIENAN